VPRPSTLTIERLGHDVVAIAQCIAIDADAFPYPSASFAPRNDRRPVWVARGEGPRILGFLGAVIGPELVEVRGIAVDRAHRGRGAGRALLRVCVRSARHLRRSGVMLCVSVTNRAAVDLYASEGFVVNRRVREYYPAGVYGDERDALQMLLAFDA
jgi:ribosomal protein S18 acetylase RimI-like enzyme